MLDEILNRAGDRIATGLRKATLITDHHATSGSIRETALRDFLRQLLPDRFYVGTGFVFDAQDRKSRQLDVVVALEPPLVGVFKDEGVCVLPCETVLACIEVKTTLTATEVARSLENARSVRSLRPYGDHTFASAQRGGANLGKHEHRCFYSIVAAGSDLVEGSWPQGEWMRLVRAAKALGLAPDVVDRIVLLDRGMINAVGGVSLPASDSIEQVAAEWFVHLSNHLDREASRRPLFDPDIYRGGREWVALE
jgi:hypothetical protein